MRKKKSVLVLIAKTVRRGKLWRVTKIFIVERQRVGSGSGSMIIAACGFVFACFKCFNEFILVDDELVHFDRSILWFLGLDYYKFLIFFS